MGNLGVLGDIWDRLKSLHRLHTHPQNIQAPETESPVAQSNVRPGLLNLALAEEIPIRRNMSPCLLVPAVLRAGARRNMCCFGISPGEHRGNVVGSYIAL